MTPETDHRFALVVVSTLLFCTLPTGVALGQVPDVPQPHNYCGVYALYAAAVQDDVPIDFPSLLNPRYVGCSKGSTLAELRAAAVDHGLHTLALFDMTPRMLRTYKEPVILYVRSDIDAPTYDHYILFQRYEDAKFVCLDADRQRPLTEAELLAVWSGTGMVVSAKEISAASIMSVGWLNSACQLLIILGGAFAARAASNWLRKRSSCEFLITACSATSVQILGVAATAMVAGFTYNRVCEAGLLAPGNQVAQIQAAHIGNFIPKLSVLQAQRAQGSATFIDARFRDDFASGHVADAISVPVDADSTVRATALRGIPRSRPLIVYCQSKGCPFAGVVASRLINDGYSDVKIYVDGWEGWHGNRNQ